MAASLKWGILGTGNIAKKFARDLPGAPGQSLAAVGSRSLEAAEKFGADFKIARRYGSYEALIADPEVDIVYISLPNHLHKEWSIRCAEAGKHILCEKPLTVNRREADEVLDVVKRCDVFLMEAFMYRCHPQTFKLKELLMSGVIGDVRMIHAHFSYNMGYNYKNIRMSNPMAGGGIMDVGCYPISIARLIAGYEPVECRATARIGTVSRVDELAAISLLFPNGIVAAISCGMQVAAENTVTIFGSDGSIHLPSPWFGPQKEAKLIVKTKSGTEEVKVDGVYQLYAIEAVHVAEHISQRQAPAMTWADSIGNMNTLDAVRQSAGVIFDCEK